MDSREDRTHSSELAYNYLLSQDKMGNICHHGSRMLNRYWIIVAYLISGLHKSLKNIN